MININGKIIPSEEAHLSIFNRGFLYGDSVFETIRVIHSKVIFWEEHYFRLMASLRIMRMEIPSHFSPEFLQDEILNLIKANELEDSAARIRFSVFRKEGGKYSPETNEIGYTISSEKLRTPFYLFNQDFYEIELYKDHFILSGLLSNLKTNNKATNILGSIFARENGYKNCFLLNEKKNVVEALNGNIFLVKGKTIKTPPLSEGCLKGITRSKLIGILRSSAEFEFSEEPISPFELQKADEIFITNVIVGLQPVSKYRKKEFNTEVAKNLLAKLNLLAKKH